MNTALATAALRAFKTDGLPFESSDIAPDCRRYTLDGMQVVGAHATHNGSGFVAYPTEEIAGSDSPFCTEHDRFGKTYASAVAACLAAAAADSAECDCGRPA
jgi:hypothetical protein